MKAAIRGRGDEVARVDSRGGGARRLEDEVAMDMHLYEHREASTALALAAQNEDINMLH